MAKRKSVKQMLVDAQQRKGMSASELSYAIQNVDDVTGQIKSPVTAEAARLTSSLGYGNYLQP